MATKSIRTEIAYLRRDSKFDLEKPYDVRFDTGGAIPMSNMINEPTTVDIDDYRPLQHAQSFEECGFMLANIQCPLTFTEFQEHDKVKTVYYPQVVDLLKNKFPAASRIEVLEHNIRRRHRDFPSLTGDVEYSQPSTAIHIDFSPESATRTARKAFGYQSGPEKRVMAVNLWKAFPGHGNEWPLALCDRRTVDPKTEGVMVDIVYHDSFTENQRLYRSAKHRWYYFKDLEPTEVIIFQQNDSLAEYGAGVPHTSFSNPNAAKDAEPRTSVELRAFIFFD